MSMFHSSMQFDEPSAQAYSQGYSRSQTWSNMSAQAYEPAEAEHRYEGSHNEHFSHRQDTMSRFEYDLQDQGEFESPEHYQYHYSWPLQRNGGGHPEDASPLSPVGTSSSSSSSSPREDCHGWINGSESNESKSCHCGKVFRRPSDLAKHQKYHIKYFSCLFSGCEKAFATQKDLSRHARTHRKGEGYRCVVEGCRKAAAGHVYSRKDNFDRHMRTAHPDL